MYNPLPRILTWYLSPVQGTAEGITQTGLGVLSSRLENQRRQPISSHSQEPLAA